jgi:N-acyl homoserine lactone hydrolase
MATYTIRPIPITKIDNFAKPLMTYKMGFGQSLSIVSYIWYLESEEIKRNILVDAGSSAARYRQRGFEAQEIQSVEDGLNKVGLGLSDIDMIIVTHLHHDHIECAKEFDKAEFVVQKMELESALNPHPALADPYIKELFEGLRFETANGDTYIEEGIELLLTPGHTLGGQSVAIETKKGKAIITGLCCVNENFNPPPEVRDRLTVIPCGIHGDALKAYDSLLRISKAADIVIPLHEATFIDVDKIPEV